MYAMHVFCIIIIKPNISNKQKILGLLMLHDFISSFNTIRSCNWEDQSKKAENLYFYILNK